MGLKKEIFIGMKDTIKKDKKNLYYILYYSFLEGILVLSIPLASSFIINSVIAHASISVIVLGVVVIAIFIFITILRVLQDYIVEKFQQKIFVEKSIEVSNKAYDLRKREPATDEPIGKLMNYFFDVTVIQKSFPIFILDGAALFVKVIISLILLLAFNLVLFELGVIALILYLGLLFLFGYNGIKYSIYRSDMKYATIYHLQKIPFLKRPKDVVLSELDNILLKYVDARKKLFGVMIKQLSISYITQGIIIGEFLIVGSYLVINGKLPIGEFVASEIVVVSIISSINTFIKQIDYIYEIIEGFYKVGKLTKAISGKKDGKTDV